MKFTKHHEYVSIGSQTANYRIILLHGWGADFHDLLPLGDAIIKDLPLDFQVISLRAPIPRSDNIGRQWYDLFPANWQQATNEVEKLISTLNQLSKNSIALQQTVLLGFSQGAAMTLAISSELEFGLVVSCSGYAHPDWNPKVKGPVLLGHGLKDNIVPIDASRQIQKRINLNSSFECRLHEFDGFHEIDKKFVDLIRQNIKNIF